MNMGSERVIFTRGNVFGAASSAVPIIGAGICFWKRFFYISYQVGGNFLIEHRASHWRVFGYFCVLFMLAFLSWGYWKCILRNKQIRALGFNFRSHSKCGIARCAGLLCCSFIRDWCRFVSLSSILIFQKSPMWRKLPFNDLLRTCFLATADILPLLVRFAFTFSALSIISGLSGRAL